MGAYKSILGRVFGVDNETGQIQRLNVSNNGTKNGSTVTVLEYGDDITHKTVLTCTSTTVTITDDPGVAQYGGVKIYDFPGGVIQVENALVSGTLTAGVTGTIIDNWDGDVALGTATATTGATLTGTEADIMPSTAVSAGASDKDGVVSAYSVATALTETPVRSFNGSSTPIDAYLNFVIDDSASHTSGTATFTGTVTLVWKFIGDL